MDLPDIDVSRETILLLKKFEALVQKWNPAINLVAKNELKSLWERHIRDSAQIYQYSPHDPKHWLDIGSGGGFPGIVMAIMAQQHAKSTQFTFIESDQRKSAFLRNASRELGLNVNVRAERIETVHPIHADVITARALKSIDTLIPLMKRHILPDGIAILPKGKSWAAEVQQAKQNWRFEVEDHRSITDADARILVIKEIASD